MRGWQAAQGWALVSLVNMSATVRCQSNAALLAPPDCPDGAKEAKHLPDAVGLSRNACRRH